MYIFGELRTQENMQGVETHVGASPSGKARAFGACIGGSNPPAPAICFYPRIEEGL